MASHGDSPRYLGFYLQYLLKRNEVIEADLWLPRLVKVAPQELATLCCSPKCDFGKALPGPDRCHR